ncbi:AI-2E family transporter [Geothrix fuzhouensis]|uniref:AI-2E family transporter n=1 Tax=Geothrix fuzhouensis TaxID=2966451 RepID=UPI0021473809|nr:AI-2E family transporter [Geothrix fuzhouensis]
MLRLVLVGISLWLAFRLWPIILVLVVALLIAGTLSPAVQWLEERKVRRGFAIAGVYLGIFILGALIVTLTIPSLLGQAVALFEREPAFRKSLADYFAQFHASAPFANWLRNMSYDSALSAIGGVAFGYSVRVFEAATYGMSALFLSLYMMIDRDRLRGGLFAVVPRSHHIRLSRVLLNLETIVGAYIRGQLVTSMLMGAFTYILLKACGIETAMALAVFAAIADILPYIGGIILLGPVVVVALGRSPAAAIIVFLAMLAYQEIESRLLIPRIYGRSLRLPSSVVLFALLVGGTLMGLLGALLALPVAATIMMLLEELRVELPGEQEQIEDRELRAQDDLAEEDYERRTEGVAAHEAAAVALEISANRQSEDALSAKSKAEESDA